MPFDLGPPTEWCFRNLSEQPIEVPFLFALREPTNTSFDEGQKLTLLRGLAVVGALGGIYKKPCGKPPLICKPSLGADQAIIAKRSQDLGLGKAITGIPELRETTVTVLRDPAFKVAAGRFRELVAREDGAAAAARELEAFLLREESVSPSVLMA